MLGEIVMGWNLLSIYDEVDVDWDSQPIFDVHLDDDLTMLTTLIMMLLTRVLKRGINES